MASSTFACLAVVLLVGYVQCQFVFGPEQVERDCVNKEMDVFFVLDSSTSIYVNDYNSELDWARRVIEKFDINSRFTRVGLLTFSDDLTRPVINLGAYSTKDELLANINQQNLPYRTGITNTHLALRYVREITEFRRGITKVIVVVTDGGSRAPGSTRAEADLAREEGFYLFVVGIGQYLDEREWRDIASDPDDQFVYNITDYRFLDNVRLSLPQRACVLPPIIVGGSCAVTSNADLIFAATNTGAQDAISLIDKFLEGTTDDLNRLRISFLIDSCSNTENVPVGDIDTYCERPGFQYYREGEFQDLLQRANSLIRRNRQDRNHRQILVLFIDSELSRRGRRLAQSIRSNIDEVVEVVIVSVGVPRFITDEFDRLGTNVIFQGGNVDIQRNSLEQLFISTCNAINEDDFAIRPN